MAALKFYKNELERIRDDGFDKYKLFNLSYDGFIKNYRPLDARFLGLALGQSRLEKMTSCSSLFLIGPPGCGKTFWVTNTVLDYAASINKKILIIVPRTALAIQYKKQIAKKDNPELLTLYTTKGLQKVHQIGNADIYLMQELNDEAIRNEIRKNSEKGMYYFAVVDEVHAFVHDAPYNSHTESNLTFLRKTCHATRRIYMTATADSVFDTIHEMELDIASKLLPLQGQRFDEYSECYMDGISVNKAPGQQMTLLTLMADYSYVNLRFYRDEKDIFQSIEACDGKSLVFVRSLEHGETLQEYFGDEAKFINAQSKLGKYADDFSEIIDTESFPWKILIVTSFLDVGINLTDWNLKNIVLFQYNMTDTIQMIGRRRRQDENDNVNVFVKIPKKEQINKEIGWYKRRLENYRIARASASQAGIARLDQIPEGSYFESTSNGGKLVFNNLFRVALNDRIKNLQEFVSVDETRFETNFCKIISSWLPACNISIDCDYDPNLMKWLLDKVTPLVQKEMSRDEIISLSNEIFDKFAVTHNDATYSKSKLNKILGGLAPPLCVENLSSKHKSGIYVIRKAV